MCRNGEFEMTTASRNNSFVQNGMLYIVPTLTSDNIGTAAVFDGTVYNITGCTFNITRPNNGYIEQDGGLVFDWDSYYRSCSAVSNATAGTVINPVHTYTEEQTAQIAALREVRPALRIQTRRPHIYRARPLTVRALDRAPRVRPVPPLRAPLARQARHPPALHARRQVEAR